MSLPERYSGSKVGRNPRYDSVVLGSPEPQKEQGGLNVTEFPSIRVRKLATISEAHSGLSARGGH